MLALLACVLFQVAGVKDWTQLSRPDPSTGTFCLDERRDRLVRFAQNLTDRVVEVWERMPAGDWHLRPRSAQMPPWRTVEQVVYDPATGSCLLFGGAQMQFTSPPQSILLNDTWLWDGTAWALAATSGPSPRQGYRIAHDPRSGSLLMIGGRDARGWVNDVWSWTGVAWSPFALAPTPAVDAPVWAFDPALGGMLLLCSSGQWLWNGAAWLRLYTWEPLPRAGAAVVADWSRRRLLLHGGRGVRVFADTWEWDGVQWTQVDAGTGMPPRTGAVLVFDRLRQRIVLGGGADPGGATMGYGDLWQWNTPGWQQIEDYPGPRAAPALAHHVAEAVTVCFGGQAGSSLGETWLLRPGGWERGSGGPSPRSGAALAYDPVRQELVLFGGAASSGTFLDDTWAWRQGQWQARAPLTRPPARRGAAMAFDRVRGRMVLCGGTASAVNTPLGDTWLWDGSNWTAAGPTLLGLRGASLTYDERRQVVVQFGHPDALGLPNVVREWTGAQWVAARVPAPDLAGPLVYDPELHACVLFGVSQATASRQVWLWDGQTWSYAGGTPFQVADCVATYDAGLQQIVAVAGTLSVPPVWNGGTMGSTWFLRRTSLRPGAPEVAPGGVATWQVRLPASARLPFVLGLAQGSDGIRVGTQGSGAPLWWPLSADRLFRLTLGWPSLLGVLDGQGVGSVALAVPNDPALDGLGLFASALTLTSAAQVAETTPAASLLVTR